MTMKIQKIIQNKYIIVKRETQRENKDNKKNKQQATTQIQHKQATKKE